MVVTCQCNSVSLLREFEVLSRVSNEMTLKQEMLRGREESRSTHTVLRYSCTALEAIRNTRIEERAN